MGRDDLLINYFLKTHDHLKSLALIKFKGKDILGNIHNLQIQAQTLQNKISSANLPSAHRSIY